MEAMRSQREGALMPAKMQLNTALNQQGQTMQELQQIKTQRANETSANAERLAALIARQADAAQFLVVSHRRPMIAAATRTIGVTQARGAHTQVVGLPPAA
jgi:chromosome segregation ATPase